MNRKSLLVTGALLGAALSASSVNAQSSSLFGDSGVTGTSGSSSGGVGSSSSGSSSSSSAGSLTGFTGAQAGTATGFVENGASSELAGMGNSGNFVGNRNSAASSTGTGQSRAGGSSSLGSMNRNNNSQQNRNNGGQTANSSTTSIRPVQRIAFDYAPRNSTAIESKLGSQISVLASQGKLRPGVTVVSGSQGTVTLRGQVGSESERRKAEIHARLEPGVRTVINELSVAPPQP